MRHPRLARLLPAVAVAAALALTATGCGFANALAHPPPVADGAADDPGVTPTTASATAVGPTVIAQTDLTRNGAVTGRLTVTLGPVRNGIPPVANFHEGCPVSPIALQYVAVGIAYTTPQGGALTGLAGHLTVRTTPTTPSGIGDLGVFFESQDGDEEYCAHYPPLPTTDTFYDHAGPAVVYGYVVLDQAVTATTPQGRPEVFPTLQVQLSNLRYYPEPGDPLPLAPATPSVGSLCPGAPAALCLPLR